MEIIIQVFHDDLHLRTLDQFLSATAQLQRQVNVKQIVISLVDRFASYAARSREEEEARRKEVLKKAQTEGPEAVEKLQEEFSGKPLTGVPDDVKLFDVFWTQIAELVKVSRQTFRSFHFDSHFDVCLFSNDPSLPSPTLSPSFAPCWTFPSIPTRKR